jgi:hypothetical protein
VVSPERKTVIVTGTSVAVTIRLTPGLHAWLMDTEILSLTSA